MKADEDSSNQFRVPSEPFFLRFAERAHDFWKTEIVAHCPVFPRSRKTDSPTG